ncbi:MAG: response regulator, partial [Candidatus Competibacteraceae bacterium]|nr:response regulator [Candidatus Competibacteraceae bacterium]
RSHDIQLTLELATGLPPLWLDRDQLSQVVLNLIVNAQHALLDVRGQRQLLISTSHDATTGTVQLQVTDNGPGVPRALRQRIFEPFYTTKPVGVGTGIGLSICRNIVAFYGGSITVQDGAGGGACFQVTLPLAPAPPAATHSDVDGQASSSTGQPLLIVDDEVEIAELLAEMLSRSGYRCSLASSGMQALQQLAAGLPELIISDLRMPDMDGPSLYQAVCRRYPQLAERFIFVTGDSLGSQTGLERIQNVPVIEKPFDMQEIGQTVSRLLAMPKPSG